MAFGGRYKVSAYIMHPTMSATAMAEQLPTLEAHKCVTVGDPNPRHGRPATCSVWKTEFDPGWVESEEDPLSEHLLDIVDRLLPYGKFFREVTEHGEAYLQIVWFAHSTHSVMLISPEIADKIGQTGLTIDLQLHEPDKTG